MPNRSRINQLDPFADDSDEFGSKQIRRSQSHGSKNPFTNVVDPEEEKAHKRNRTLLIVLPIIAVIIATVIVLVVLLPKPEEPAGSGEITNPTGRKPAIDDVPALDDPETRAGEQEKLDAVLALLDQDDWEYTNALFETIFPDYLDDCGKYDYYRAAISLAKNFEYFSISEEVATARAEALVGKCNRADSDSNP